MFRELKVNKNDPPSGQQDQSEFFCRDSRSKLDEMNDFRYSIPQRKKKLGRKKKFVVQEPGTREEVAHCKATLSVYEFSTSTPDRIRSEFLAFYQRTKRELNDPSDIMMSWVGRALKSLASGSVVTYMSLSQSGHPRRSKVCVPVIIQASSMPSCGLGSCLRETKDVMESDS